MKLRRSFIDVKRLSNIGLNKFVREPWLLDYLKSISKPLEYTNNVLNTTTNTVGQYTLYNGQKLTLKTFVDDEWDIVDRRSIISENQEETYSFYGYYDEVNDEWKTEYDPNPTSLYGYYSGSTDTWYLEPEVADSKTIYGYVMFKGIEALQDVEPEDILDSAPENIYTSEDNTSDEYIWFLEGQNELGLFIYIHNDKYTTMTEDDIQELIGKLSRYIVTPTTYGIRGYN